MVGVKDNDDGEETHLKWLKKRVIRDIGDRDYSEVSEAHTVEGQRENWRKGNGGHRSKLLT